MRFMGTKMAQPHVKPDAEPTRHPAWKSIAASWLAITVGSDPGLFAYALILVASVGICLAFDVVDVIRWWRGERYLMGSPEAVQMGASLPAPVL